MSKHTPGPWKVIPPNSSSPAWFVTGPDQRAVGQVLTAEDALLVLAAPDMKDEHERQVFSLHVLAGFINSAGAHHPDWPDAVELIQQMINGACAAIAKAEGKS